MQKQLEIILGSIQSQLQPKPDAGTTMQSASEDDMGTDVEDASTASRLSGASRPNSAAKRQTPDTNGSVAALGAEAAQWAHA